MFNNLGIWYDDRPMYQVLGWRLCTGAPFDIYLKGLNSSGFYYEMATVVIVTMKSSTLKICKLIVMKCHRNDPWDVQKNGQDGRHSHDNNESIITS